MCYKMAQKSNVSGTFLHFEGLQTRYSGKMTTDMSKPSQQNEYPACNIFEFPHYFLLDP